MGDRVFESFGDTDGAGASRIDTAGSEFQLTLAPFTGAGFFTTLSFVDRIAMQAIVASNLPPATPAQGASGQLVVANGPSPADTLASDPETGDPAFFAPASAIVTISTLNGPDGIGAASPGLSSFQLGSIQDSAAVPEPASFALIGTGLLYLGLLRKRSA